MRKFTFLLLFALSLNLHAQQLPYPIIFVHGLNSNSNIWLDTWSNDDESPNKIGNFMLAQNLQYGGRIDYCLNDDGNNATASTIFWPNVGEDIATFTSLSSLNVGDFYLVNFDIDPNGILSGMDGFTESLSNESAIVKQGVALRDAIGKVLIKTGRDKVILMGHSMGGLCAREYLQNPINWQPDGQHHVAKLATTGTPHGGFTGINFSIITGINSRSEAYRDLRKETVSSNDGVYLYGGSETVDNIGGDYYSYDTNCNGFNADGLPILGLNEKILYTDIDYSCIIGHCTNCFVLQGNIPGDGIVREENANFDYNLPEPRNEFLFTADASTLKGLHSDLPKSIIPNMQGLDEPNEYNVSYAIENGIEYLGFISQQPVSGYQYDYDDYKFTTSSNGAVVVSIQNTYSDNLNVRFVDSTQNILYSTTISGNSSGTLSGILPSGTYYLEIYGIPSTDSYMHPYTFSIGGSLENSDLLISEMKIYPNPTNDKLFVNSPDNIDKIEIYNLLGQKVIDAEEYTYGINVRTLPSGTYVLKVKSIGGISTQKFIKE